MTIEYFEIVPNSVDQTEDGGWYFQVLMDGIESGDPLGPFHTKEEAINESKVTA